MWRRDLILLIRYPDIMREMSASDASRNFSAVLDCAEQGETIVVTQGGKRVALIVPAPRANGPALREVFRRWQGNAAFGDSFTANVAACRTIATTDERAHIGELPQVVLTLPRGAR